MKKIALLISFLTPLAFVSCGDNVFDDTTEGSDTVGSAKVPVYEAPDLSQLDSLIVFEPFTDDFGTFSTYETPYTRVWYIDQNSATASEVSRTADDPATRYLISDEIDLTGCTEAHASFEYFYAGWASISVLIQPAENFQEDARNQGWTNLYRISNGTNLQFSRERWDIPSEWIGKKVRMAIFYYGYSSPVLALRIRNFYVAKGSCEAFGQAGNGKTSEFDSNLLRNGGFENLQDGLPIHWNGYRVWRTLKSDCVNGQYACLITLNNYDNNINYSISSELLELKPGTYTFSIYAKGKRMNFSYTTNRKDAGGSWFQEFKSDETTIEVSPDCWTRVEYTFQVEETTWVSVSISNPVSNSYYEGCDLLLDDACLTTTDGGLVSYP